MLPLMHLLIGLIFSMILFPIFGWNVWIVLLSSVLIDIDHPPVYFLVFKEFSLKKSFKFFKGKETLLADKLCAVLHTVEFLILILALSYFSDVFFLIFLGLLSHSITDFFYILYKFNRVRVFSLILWLKNGSFNKMKFYMHKAKNG